MNDGRALTEAEVAAIQKDFFAGLHNDQDIDRLFKTIAVQRGVIKKLFSYFIREPLRRVSTAEPVLNSELAHLRELASLEDNPDRW